VRLLMCEGKAGKWLATVPAQAIWQVFANNKQMAPRGLKSHAFRHCVILEMILNK
jgi:hypothetical protein